VGRINLGRVVVGGLVAGLLINISEAIMNGVVFAAEMDAAMKALNKPPIASSMILCFVIFCFGLGMMLVWLYAAIRPRFGPGVQTAVCASLTVWGFAYLYPNLFMLVLDIFPRRLTIISIVWGLGEVVVAGLAGARLYSET
jgi:pimeloyl-ACP methyl ester carboxylesterase